MLIVSLATTLLLALSAQGPTSIPATADADVLGETTLTGDVRRVLGPRLFTITTPAQLGETLVLVPGADVAALRTGSAVVVTGVVQASTAATLDHEWGSFESERARHADYSLVLVAERVTSDGIDAAISAAARAVGSNRPRTPTASDQALTDVESLAATTDTRLVGRAVDLRNATIRQVVSAGGFWIAAGGEELFIRPADESRLRDGQRVNLKGVVLELPEGMANRLGNYSAARDETIYVYASQIRTL